MNGTASKEIQRFDQFEQSRARIGVMRLNYNHKSQHISIFSSQKQR